MKQKKGDSEGC